jgi:hypothetical protein
MRTHAEIIRDAGGPQKVRDRLGLDPKKFETVKSWFVRDSIPAEHWRRLADEGLATLHELAVAAEARSRKERAA